MSGRKLLAVFLYNIKESFIELHFENIDFYSPKSGKES